jgi:hypothetical protein
MRNSTRLLQFALIAGACAFGFALVRVIVDRHAFFSWLLLGGTFGNLMVFRALAIRSRAG